MHFCVWWMWFPGAVRRVYICPASTRTLCARSLLSSLGAASSLWFGQDEEGESAISSPQVTDRLLAVSSTTTLTITITTPRYPAELPPAFHHYAHHRHWRIKIRRIFFFFFFFTSARSLVHFFFHITIYGSLFCFADRGRFVVVLFFHYALTYSNL